MSSSLRKLACLLILSVFAFSSSFLARVSAEKDTTSIGDITPMWYVEQPVLSDAYEDYEFKSNDRIYSFYDENYIEGFANNDEIYGFFGVDTTEEEVRLLPVNDLGASNNITAEGATSITVRTVSSLPYHTTVNSDTIRLNQLDSSLYINSTQQVLLGMILYRTKVSGGSWSTWNYISVASMADTSVSLNFTAGKYVQLVIIYEVKEAAPHWYQPHKYYHVRGVYHFLTSSN
jgi:hypothetical protein